MNPRSEARLLVVLTLFFLIVSRIGPKDRATWWMEVAPVLIALPLLILTSARFPLSRLCTRLLFVHGLILMLGGHYTYAEVPLGEWAQHVFGWSRNHYDRLGHFAQGFVPAILVREILVRASPLRRGNLLLFLVTSVCLALSACYEFVEWWAALLGGASAEAFLGTQGDPWDTQWDMFLALCGALTAQISLSRLHDRAVEQVELRHLAA